MSTRIAQATRALRVIPSDYCDIPYPNPMCGGSTEPVSVGNILVDAQALPLDFYSIGVSSGDIVYFSAGVAGSVVRVISSSSLELNIEVPQGSQAYDIYKGGQNNGCTLYIGNTGDVVMTAAGDSDLELVSVIIPSQIFPIQVKKVWSSGTSARDIIALW